MIPRDFSKLFSSLLSGLVRLSLRDSDDAVALEMFCILVVDVPSGRVVRATLGPAISVSLAHDVMGAVSPNDRNSSIVIVPPNLSRTNRLGADRMGVVIPPHML
jgi:hypothetical protein